MIGTHSPWKAGGSGERVRMMVVVGGRMCLNYPAPTCKLDSSDGGRVLVQRLL